MVHRKGLRRDGQTVTIEIEAYFASR